MKIPKLARYNNVVGKAFEFTLNNISSYPINLIDLINNQGWTVMTYSELAKTENISTSKVCEYFGKDAFTVYSKKNNNYTIAYNDTIQPTERINFSLAHEIGHIIIGHLIDFDQTTLCDNLSKEEYKILENEANSFARNLLAPAPLFNKVYTNIFNVFQFKYLFGLTLSASTTRKSLLKNDLYYLNDKQINTIIQKYKYYKNCNKCNLKYLDIDFNYCPRCGNNIIKKGDGFSMKKYKGLDIKDLEECPICENVEISENDNYCKICGISLKNKCINQDCNASLDNSARYCPYCGEKSLLFRDGMLEDWSIAGDAEEYIKIDDPEELPF